MRLWSASREGPIALIAVAVLATCFIVASWGPITSLFGDSDEGINGSVWAYNSRSLRDLGPMSSGFGGRRLDGTLYATHPPLIVVEAALAESVAGEHEWSSRAPAWIGSLAALVLLYSLSRSLGADRVGGAAAVVLTAATPMFFVYGTMLDTPVTSFPFGLAVALCWNRDWGSLDQESDAVTSRRWIWRTPLVALACLSGWQATLLVAICCVSLLARATRTGRRAVELALPYLCGGLIGAALSVGWAWWTYGSLDALMGKFTRRSGSSAGTSLGEVLDFQSPWILQLLGLSAGGLIACLIALRNRTFRPLAGLSLVTVSLYTMIFREAAAGHQYWMYWLLFPTLVGVTYVISGLASVWKTGPHGDVAAPALIVFALVIGAVDLGMGTQARVLISDGLRPAELLLSQPLPRGDAIYYIGQPFRPDSWILYYTGRHGQDLGTEDEIGRLARDQPDTPVLVLGSCEGPESDPAYRICKRMTGDVPTADGRRAPRIVSASALARELGVTLPPSPSEGGPPPLPPPKPSAP